MQYVIGHVDEVRHWHRLALNHRVEELAHRSLLRIDVENFGVTISARVIVQLLHHERPKQHVDIVQVALVRLNSLYLCVDEAGALARMLWVGVLVAPDHVRYVRILIEGLMQVYFVR